MKTMIEKQRQTWPASRAATSGETQSRTCDQPRFGRVPSPALSLKTILVPIDFSNVSWKALEYASGLARYFGSTICLMHVFNRGLFRDRDHVQLAESVDEAVSEATRELGTFSPQAIAPGFRGRTIARTGRPFHEICQVAETHGIDVILMATHENTGLDLPFGGTVEKVVRHSSCPVLAIGESSLSNGGDAAGAAPTPWKQILVPVDFSECSRLALTCAVDLAGHLDAKIHLLNVLKTRYWGWRPQNLFEALAKMRRRVENQLDAWFEHGIPAAVRGEELERWGVSVADVIERTGERRKIDLIIIGTHGYTGLKRFWKGSIAEQIVRHAPCPVLTIPKRALERQESDNAKKPSDSQ